MNVEAVKSRYENQLMSLPNVTGIGIREKAGKRVIAVYVTRKVPVASLRPQDIVPQNLEGWEVDVQEIGVTRTLE
jgi:hypothetical protein